MEPVLQQSDREIAAIINLASVATQAWRHTPIAARARHFMTLAALLRQKAGELSALMTREMGKPITQAEEEVEKCAVCCEYFAQHAAEMIAWREMPSDGTRSGVRFDPLGAVLAIMPWNFPLWQVIRFAAPSLMAGNVALLKHAPNVPGCARALQRLFDMSAFPPGVWGTVFASLQQVQTLIAHPAIAAVTLTGSTRAGISVATAAAKVLKKSVLELGGSDAFIVLADADISMTARAAAMARCRNNGQSCISAKRFLVEGSIYDAFADALVEEMRALQVGDPANRETQVGPLARLDLLENVTDQVQRSITAGARLLCGGSRLDRKGYFYPPTVLDQVLPGNPAFDEEIFGPVAPLTLARDAEHAIQLANQSQFGLGTSIWTRDISRAQHMAGEIQAGSIFINGAVRSDPRLPFGGIKQSGWGRELAAFGIHEFVNIKTVWQA